MAKTRHVSGREREILSLIADGWDLFKIYTPTPGEEAMVLRRDTTEVPVDILCVEHLSKKPRLIRSGGNRRVSPTRLEFHYVLTPMGERTLAK